MVLAIPSEKGNIVDSVDMEDIVDSVDTRGFTRSERCYTFKEMEKKSKRKTKEGEGIREKNIEATVSKALEKNKLITNEEVKNS